jgi:hypothetical protein
VSKRFTYEEVREIVESKGYELISTEYKGMNAKLIFKDADGFTYETSLNTVKKG